MTPTLTDRDLRELAERGIAAEEAQRQLGLLATPPAPPAITRAATLDDGIRRIPDADHDRLTGHAEEAAGQGRVSKFVPASGAATRMFKAPLALLGEHGADGLDADRLETLADDGSENAREVLQLGRDLERLPFVDALFAAAREASLDPQALLARGSFGPLLEQMVSSEGLGLAARPKGLVPFHRYPDGGRSAFMEHIAEAALYIADEDGICRLHFTVPAGQREAFGAELGRSGKELADRLGIGFQVSFSRQAAATDTLALDADGQPFRREDGSLLLRPGGHGALLGNLAYARGDLVVIKTVDNLVPEARHPEIAASKKLLLGLAVEVQQGVATQLAALEEEGDGASLAVTDWVRRGLGIEPPRGLAGARLTDWLRRTLERPLRVCGMVANEGEPGGGPFWVRNEDGTESLQIVEAAQIAPGDRHLLAHASHFNPVDLVCGVRDRFGGAYDLQRFVDPKAVFVADKSEGGRELRALERPGLWNGSMARWNTLFVEVPAGTFAPVKTVADLLRPEHQVATED